MNLLAIDTSTDVAFVTIALFDEVFSVEQAGLRQHAQCLLPMIESLLLQAKLKVNQLDGLVFGCGPGSFTGLRIACSVAKGLAYAHDLPLYPVSSLLAIANEMSHREASKPLGTPILAMLDARMHQVYWGYFKAGSLEGQEQVSDPQAIILNDSSPLILAGVGLEPYVTLLPEAIKARILSVETMYPKASAMIRVVEAGQINPVSAAEALPLYVRNQVTEGGK